MSAEDFFYVLKRILLSPSVIGITIGVNLFLQLFFYVANYNKNPEQIREKRLRIHTDSSEKKTEQAAPETDEHVTGGEQTDSP